MSELPKLESASSEPSENVGNALNEESSSESRGSEETLSTKETESFKENSNSEDCFQILSTTEPDNLKTDDSKDEPIVTEITEGSKDIVKADDSKGEPITTETTEGSKNILETNDSKDEPLTLEVTKENKDILETKCSKDEPISVEMTEGTSDILKTDDSKDEPITIEMTEGSKNDSDMRSNASEIVSEESGVIEDSSKTSESIPSSTIVIETDVDEDSSKNIESISSEKIATETALKTENSNAGDADSEKMEIETEVLPPETEELENDVEMVEENASNEEKKESPSAEAKNNSSSEEKCENSPSEAKNENSQSEEKSENPPSKEMKESPLCEEKNENSSCEENNEMEIDPDVVDEDAKTPKPEVQQKEDAPVESACTDKPELEVIEDSSAKSSMDSETLGVNSDLNVSEKVDAKEEEIEVLEDSSDKKSMDSETMDPKPDANASVKVAVNEKDMKSENNAAEKDAEKKKVLFMPIDLGIDPGPLEDFTAQEIMNYLGEKVTEYMMNPELNELLRVQIESAQLRDQVRAKTEELGRLQTFMDKLNRDQDKFLRHFGVLPKIPTTDMSVFVDWAALDSFPANNVNIKEQIQKNEQLTLTPCGTSPKNNVSATNAASGSSTLKKSPVPKKDGPVECIDLTDEVEAPNKAINKAPNFKTYSIGQQAQVPMKSPNKVHPAPLPIMPNRVNRYLKESPPKPRVKISCDDKGIILQWDADITDKHEKLQCFEIFGYQEQKNQNITSALWKRIGNVKTLSLPMACTLTKFVPGNNYHFTVRGLDIHNRPGIFSDPVSTRFDPVVKKT
ncbi:serine-aspartate repeat-containing protein F-like isoform X2 [Uloborus diversus]|uniref:serine-aspartate repeat-containing protein F-like isoform X2 n=1 Tax=Uloborus diversus TaxID=327109 RepID=UPI002409E457|nr:serine-aspartate repeat-containing protein F-like isoform X2 [Uloborus diversus]